LIEWPLNKHSVVKTPNEMLDPANPKNKTWQQFVLPYLRPQVLTATFAIVLFVAYLTFGVGHTLEQTANVPPVAHIETGESQSSTLMCDIKGNINDDGERVVLNPDDLFYNHAKIDKSKGEDFFCEPAEAEKWAHQRDVGSN